MRKLLILLAIISTTILVGCASTRIDNLRKPVNFLKRAADYASPRGVRRTSLNGRTFFSEYFSRKGDFSADATRSKYRAYSKITILGDSRPYDVTFEVIIEKRSGRRYTRVGESSKLAREIKDLFRDFLAKRPNNRDLIDDFRAF